MRAGSDTLIAAPTGTGKTLAGFLVAIDACYRAHTAGELPAAGTRVVYVSPLKALAVDIQANLTAPLREIAQVAQELGMASPDLTVQVRTGDTSAAGRRAMGRTPPTFLVTTPESLFLLLTAAGGRAALGDVRTVIVDEIHAVARDRRGAHLALSLERLEHLQPTGRRPQRIGLSATQRPLEVIGALLSGVGPGRATRIVDCGHQRDLDLLLELPGSELAAVASSEQLDEVLDRIADQVGRHRTTLVFVNTRRMAERFAHRLGERLGGEQVAAHHGSLSRERRQRVEAQLRAGELRALVATASLELGIDIGPVELVCQVGTPRSIATLLQRVGRANHAGGTPKGRLFPMTRDELVECTALLAAVRGGDLDAVRPPAAPLDILAQQVVAEVAAEPWGEAELRHLVRRAAPYAELADADFDDVLALVDGGIVTGRGPRGALVHRDRVGGRLQGRRGARLAAVTGGGAIPDAGDYRVLADPDDTLVGTINEDFAIESMPGDVFLLGSHAWRIRRVEAGVVRVVDAAGATPTVPFWLGEAPARTAELSAWVSRLRRGVDEDLAAGGEARALAGLVAWSGVGDEAAGQVVRYLAAARAVLGILPSQETIVFERFFDATGATQLVVHVPMGGRINRAFGLALRKRLCVTFDFELQAAASDDAVVLSLGPQHGFPLRAATRLVRAATVETTLTQAVLPTPLFATRWRWNLTRALVISRARSGRRTPIAIQRMEADDCMAAVFPQLAACQENAPPGPIALSDHVLVRQTLADCLTEAMDLEGLRHLLERVESGAVAVRCVEPAEPSVLAHEILNSRPYTFLDDAPLEERRTRAVPLRRGLPPTLEGFGIPDPEMVRRVVTEAQPDPRDAAELHDLLTAQILAPPEPTWATWFEQLVQSGRAATVRRTGTGRGGPPLWCVAERRRAAEAILGPCRFEPALAVPPGLLAEPAPDGSALATDAVRGHLDTAGPFTCDRLAARTGLDGASVAAALGRLQADGFAAVGPDPGERELDGPSDSTWWYPRRLLHRLHAAATERRRRSVEPVTAREFMRFLLRWQHVAPGTRLAGRAGVLAAIEQLQGFPSAAGTWEESLLASRVERYQPQWLDELCLAGQVVWARLRPPQRTPAMAPRGATSPSRATPISFTLRGALPLLLRAVRGDAEPIAPPHGAAGDILRLLRDRGALFHADIQAAGGRLPVEVEEGLWELVAGGLVTADGFQAVRVLLSARERWRRRQLAQARARGRGPLELGAGARGRGGGEGRWALLPAPDRTTDPDRLAELVAGQLLLRWGVVFYDLAAFEELAVPWREVVRALRRLEARGLVRGGRFVTGFVGEQYARPDALEPLRAARRSGPDDEMRLSCHDPLNLVGVILPGSRLTTVRRGAVVYRDGVPA